MEIPDKTKPERPTAAPNSRHFNVEDLASELYERGRAADFGIAPEDFFRTLQEILGKNLEASDEETAARELLASLRIDELCVARGCAAGDERAWEAFLLRYREPLYDMAHSIAKEDNIARELADNMFADLYGTNAAGGERVPSCVPTPE